MSNNSLVLNTNAVSNSNKNTVKPKSLWWEEPLDEFVEMLQQLHRDYAPYFPRLEMEDIYNEVSLYALQRGKLWEEQIRLGISPEYLQYLKDDLTIYLHHVYDYLKEDVIDRKSEFKPTRRRRKAAYRSTGSVYPAQPMKMAVG